MRDSQLDSINAPGNNGQRQSKELYDQLLVCPEHAQHVASGRVQDAIKLLASWGATPDQDQRAEQENANDAL
jgi:hypothetical protein